MRIRKTKAISVEDTRRMLIAGGSVPTSVLSASKKRNYVVQSRGTIFGKPKTKQVLSLGKMR